MEVTVEPNSEQWHSMRRRDHGLGSGASEFSLMCGISPYCLPAEYYDWRIAGCPDTGLDPEDPRAYPMKRGHIVEPGIRDLVYARLVDKGLTVTEGKMYIPDEKPFSDYFGATTDINIYDANGVWVAIGEIKGPIHGLFSDAYRTKEVRHSEYDPEEHMPLHYYCQVQGQLWITKKPYCDFIVVHFPGEDIQKALSEGTASFTCHRVYPSVPFIEWMKQRLLRFVVHLKTGNRPNNKIFADISDMPKKKKVVNIGFYDLLNK